jgi:hypothetical protein
MGEIKKKFGSFPFSLRQLDDERTAKAGVIECVRGNILRQYDVLQEKDGKDVARLFTTISESLPKSGFKVTSLTSFSHHQEWYLEDCCPHNRPREDQV